VSGHSEAICKFSETVERAIAETPLDGIACAAVLTGLVAYLLKREFRHHPAECEVMVGDVCALLRATALRSRTEAMAFAAQLAAERG